MIPFDPSPFPYSPLTSAGLFDESDHARRMACSYLTASHAGDPFAESDIENAVRWAKHAARMADLAHDRSSR